MARNISFMLTTQQFVDGTKDVTRRMGWGFLCAGDLLMAVEKSQGLGKGGKVKRLGLIQVVQVSLEPLRRMFDDRAYGNAEIIREGFPLMTVKGFIEMFCNSHKKCTPESIVTRIEFVRLPAPPVQSGEGK
jgi:hypothetical protein